MKPATKSAVARDALVAGGVEGPGHLTPRADGYTGISILLAPGERSSTAGYDVTVAHTFRAA